ncbi:MAG: hypothetical protein ACOC33_01610 [bacterium]
MFLDVRLNGKKFIMGDINKDKHIIFDNIKCDNDLKCKYCNKPLTYYVLKKNHTGYVKIKGCNCKMKEMGNKCFVGSIVGNNNINEYWEMKKQKEKSRLGVKVIDEFIHKYGNVEGRKKYDEWKIKCNQSLDNFILRYGQEEGRKKYESFRKKSDNKSLNYYINKYGNDLGQKYYDQNILHMSKNNYFTIGWWLNKYKNYDVALEKYINNQIRDLNYFVNKYGAKQGKQKYISMCTKRNYSKSLDGFIDRFGELDGTNKYNEYRELIYKKTIGSKLFSTYSNISMELFQSLLQKINRNFLLGEYEFYINHNNKTYYYDFTDVSKKKIIEFNGDFWHANPKLYEKNDIHPITNKKSYEIWQHDKLKYDAAIQNGYDILIIWEYEYKKDKTITIDKCVNFLEEK